MSQKDILHIQIFQKQRGNLASESPRLFPMHILSPHFERGLFQGLTHGKEGGERGTKNNLAFFCLMDLADQGGQKFEPLRHRVVHLPVGNNQFGSHNSNAFNPGSFFPSINSRLAPPPVEIWVIWFSSPACTTAEAESPPPMMVAAFFNSAMAWAMPYVPLTNCSI